MDQKFIQPEDHFDMEIPDPDELSNKIVLGCLVLLILFAFFGFGSALYFLFR